MIASRALALLRWALLISALLAAGCSDDETTTPLIPPSALASAKAPEDMDFATIHDVTVEIPAATIQGRGEFLFLKVSTDPSLKDHVFLGRISNSAAFKLNMSFPKATRTLYYELYDESGKRDLGELPL